MGSGSYYISGWGWPPWPSLTITAPGSILKYDYLNNDLLHVATMPDTSILVASNGISLNGELYFLRGSVSAGLFFDETQNKLCSYNLTTSQFNVIDSLPSINMDLNRDHTVLISDNINRIFSIGATRDSISYITSNNHIWSYTVGDSTIQWLYVFDSVLQGTYPANYIHYDSALNSIFGYTDSGGINNLGVLYKYDLNTNQYHTLYHFQTDHGELGLVSNNLLIPTVLSVLQKSNALNFQIFPNPGKDIVWFRFDRKSNAKDRIQLRFYDLRGTEVLKTALGSLEESVNITDLAPALYIVQLQIGKKMYTQRFLKQ
jgi:hypothetical protein